MEEQREGWRKWGEGNTESEMEGQREGWERAGTQDEEQRLHKTLTCIHAVVHLVVTGLSIFTQVAWGWGFWELEGRWFITWPPVWLLSRPLQTHSFRPLRRGRELKAGLRTPGSHCPGALILPCSHLNRSELRSHCLTPSLKCLFLQPLWA